MRVAAMVLVLMAVAAGLLATGSPRPACVVCRAELRSWVVSRPHPGRHLFMVIECPRGFEHLSGRVEYTSASLRWDYAAPEDRSIAPRVARMSRGGILVPFFGDVNDTRLEGMYVLTLEQAWCLQRDRMFARAYELLGPNSTSGMLATLQGCGCEMPEGLSGRGGWLNEFPGAEHSPGVEITAGRWARYGVASGPVPIVKSGGGDTGAAAGGSREQRVQSLLPAR